MAGPIAATARISPGYFSASRMAPYPPMEIPIVAIALLPRPRPLRWHIGMNSSVTMAIGSSPGWGFQ